VGKGVARFLIEYKYLISVLIIGFIVWAIVFNVAVIDYTNTGVWKTRTAWLGPFPSPGTVQIFGYTIEYQVEGYSDYSFYYVHWGYNSLNGVMPYGPGYGTLEMDGIINNNGAHMFPPFTSYLYAAGIALGNLMGWENWGIGFLLAAFGYLTALPVYGIASELANNKRVGEVAALTYLLNPLMLYHTDFLWFNPSPFVFFFFAGFFMLIRGKRLTGTLLIVSAALFKQTAWFLGIPLVMYLLVKTRERKSKDEEKPKTDAAKPEGEEETDIYAKVKNFLQPFIDYFDFKNFLISVVMVLAFMGAVMLPFLIAQPNFMRFWRLALGTFSFENYVDLPPYNVPMRIQVLAILAGKPGLAELLDIIIVSGGPLGFGVILCAGLMVLQNKFVGEENIYFRRILFLTLLMMLIVTLVGPRGVFKYYFVMIMPFFSIFSSARMIRGSGEHVPVSVSMIWLPITLTLMILIPGRNIYLAYVLLIFLGYVFAPLLDRLYHIAKAPFRVLKGIMQKLTGITKKALTVRERSPDISRKRFIVNIITQSALLGLGIIFIIFGWWTIAMAMYVSVVTGLEVILVFSAFFVVGFQFLSMAISSAMSGEARLLHLNRNLHEFSTITAVILWIFSIRTFFLSWPVDILPERHLLVISSAFVSIWAVSLLVNQSDRVRIMTDVLILGGLSIELYIWHSFANTIQIFLGSISFCLVTVHLVLIFVYYFDRADTNLPNETQTPPLVEGDAVHDQSD
jgi:hypothetical protein